MKKERQEASDQCSSARAIQRSRSQGRKRLRWASPLVQTNDSDVKLKRGAAIDAVTFALAFQRDGDRSRSGRLRTEVEEDYVGLREDAERTERRRRRSECTSLHGRTADNFTLDACAAFVSIF